MSYVSSLLFFSLLVDLVYIILRSSLLKQIGGHEPALLDKSLAPSPRFIDTLAISLVRSLCLRLPFAKRKVVSTVQDGHTNVPEEDLTDGHFSEGNVDSSDTGKVGKSRMKKRKAAGGRRK